jgi:hypothetical protein
VLIVNAGIVIAQHGLVAWQYLFSVLVGKPHTSSPLHTHFFTPHRAELATKDVILNSEHLPRAKIREHDVDLPQAAQESGTWMLRPTPIFVHKRHSRLVSQSYDTQIPRMPSNMQCLSELDHRSSKAAYSLVSVHCANPHHETPRFRILHLNRLHSTRMSSCIGYIRHSVAYDHDLERPV